MKACSTCGKTKPLDAFWVNSARSDGRFRRCADCARQIQSDRRERVRAVIVAAKEVPCADCGNIYPPVVMDFDHRHEAKIVKIADWPRHVGSSPAAIAKLEAEIAKCEVVCANCHRLRHTAA